MQLKENSSEKKLTGSYYTPKELAKSIVNLLDIKKESRVLEPSCGDGIFIDCLKGKNSFNNLKIDAIEIDKNAINKVKNKYFNCSNVKTLHKDFFDFYHSNKNKKYDLIIGNPPYIRYQYLTDEQRKLQSEILKKNKMKPNKLINAWVAFTVSCVEMLKPDGTLAFVIPSELLQVGYASELRKFLLNNLSEITIIAFKKLIFSDIEQETIVLIGSKKTNDKGIRIIEVNDIKDITKSNLKKYNYFKQENYEDKWTNYLISQDVTILDRIKKDSRFMKLSDCCLINVGITTGNNNYFTIDKNIEEKYSLKNATIPLIGRSSQAYGIYFTKEDWNINVNLNKKAKLLVFPDKPYKSYPRGYKDYISLGEKNNENDGYKCRIRERWYIVPSVWVPDGFFLRRNNLYPKFVLNKCDAVSTDTMHRIKFKDGIDGDDILLSYYNSISFAFTEICGRSYGGGVLEILPGEAGNILVPKISGLIDEADKNSLLKSIDKIIRNNEDIEKVLDLVDDNILIKKLGLDRKTCNQCRKIWKEYQQRRINRSH